MSNAGVDVMKDVFGSESDDEEQQQREEDNEDQREGVTGGSHDVVTSDKGAQLKELFGSDDEGGTEDGTEDREGQETGRGPPITVPVALHSVLAPEPLRLAKLSNIISIEGRPFDSSTYTVEDEAYYVDDRGQKRIRLRDSNVIRWRYSKESPSVRESNARLVRWSDGSVTLQVGEEVMEAREIDMSGDHTFLFARHPNLIQGQGPLLKKMVFRPPSLASVSHKKLAAAIDRHHGTRQQRVRATTTLIDPKKEKEEREKAEEARIRDLEQLTGKQNKVMRRYVPPAPARQLTASGKGLSAAYLEEEEEEEEEDDDDGFIVRDEDVPGHQHGGDRDFPWEDEEDEGEEEEVEEKGGNAVEEPARKKRQTTVMESDSD